MRISGGEDCTWKDQLMMLAHGGDPGWNLELRRYMQKEREEAVRLQGERMGRSNILAAGHAASSSDVSHFWYLKQGGCILHSRNHCNYLLKPHNEIHLNFPVVPWHDQTCMSSESDSIQISDP